MDTTSEQHTSASTPPTLLRVEAFLNTLDERRFTRRGRRFHGHDHLATEAALAAWLAEHGLLSPGEQVSHDTFMLAMALRGALRSALATAAGHKDDPEAAVALRSLPLYLDVDSLGTVSLRPLEDRARGAIASLAAEVAVAAAAGTWSRLKMCASSECRWVFYDGSRNGLGRWCAMSSCGNRAKTRTYRRRHGHHAGGPAAALSNT